MKRVLVTAIGGDIGSAVLECLKDSFEPVYLVGCDVKEFNQGLEYTDVFYIAPPYTEVNRYLDFIIWLCKEEKIDIFLPIAEKEIEIIDKNRHLFEAIGIKVLINDSHILKICLSKYNTATFLNKHGILVPETYTREDMPKDMKFPVIVKAEYGCGSKKLAVVSDLQQLTSALYEIPQAVIQEYIGTAEEEYTVGIFSDGKEIRSIAFKRYLGLGGMSVYVETVYDSKILLIAEKVAKAFDLRGCINVQLRKDGEDFYVFEINPRISSTVGFRHKMGFEDVKWWVESMENEGNISEYKGIQNKIIGIKKVSELLFDAVTRSKIGGGPATD